MKVDRRHFLAGTVGASLAACSRPLRRGQGLTIGDALTTALDRPRDLAAALQGKRVAILTHAAGVNWAGARSIDILHALLDVRLVAIWSPEHGLSGGAAAGALVGDGRDAATGLPIHSLYGASKTPTRAMLDAVDAVFVDLQDVGTRPYTYASTLLEVLKAARATRTMIIVNDRPNPLGGIEMEGPVLDPALSSFVGVWPIPLRHGLTLGELARMMNGERLGSAAPIGAALTVLPIHGWRRSMAAEAFGPGGLPFIAPSPNLRSADAILAYAGTVLFEGTSVSEGRGTDAPFLTLCAPFLEPDRLRAEIGPDAITGAHLLTGKVVPQTARYQGERCGAIHLRITDAARYRPVYGALHIMAMLFRFYPDKMHFLEGAPPFFDRLAGGAFVRDALLKGVSAQVISDQCQAGLARFQARRKPWLLYG